MKARIVLGLFTIAAAAQGAVDFQKQIKPILEQSCLKCHGPTMAAGGVRLQGKTQAMQVIVPGKPGQSRLLLAVEMDPAARGAMPPGGRQLQAADRRALRDWILEGAPWPEGSSLTMAGGAPRPKDDIALAESLHKRIIAAIQPAKMEPYKTTIPNTDVSFEMVPIPGGEFVMGTPDSESGRRNDEGPQHKVRIDPFWMGKYEVTWNEYRLFMFASQSGEMTGADRVIDGVSRPTAPFVEMSFGMGTEGFPAISMTQHAANKFAQWLSAKTGQFYRLPTEAEWEYACRAGTTTAYSFGNDASKLGEFAWYNGNSDSKYQKVGTKKPNPWGLYDMHGNVKEWTLDQYQADIYSKLAVDNPWVASKTPYPHVARGGSWQDDPGNLRCGARVSSDPSWKMQDPQLPKSIWYMTDAQGLGLRVVRPLKVPSAAEMFKFWNNGVERE